MDKKYDVIIIGAGFAGLAAGLSLKKNGLNTIILEARSRVGGRTETKWLDDGTQIDLGGQWLGPTQDRMYELADEYGVKTFPSQLFGKGQYHYLDGVHDNEPEEMLELLEAIDELADQVDLDHPHESPDIATQDRMTLASWLSLQTEDKEVANFVGRMLAGGLLASDAGEVSLFQMLYYIKAGGGTQSLLGAKGGAQQDRVVGGPQAIAEKMAEDHGSVLYDQVVKEVIKQDNDYLVETRSGDSYSADHVLIAVPPTVVNSKITFTPELPVWKKKTLQSILPGSASKFHAVYEKPFWREDGLSGQRSMSEGLIIESLDNSLENEEKGILTFFVYGIDSIQLSKLPEAKRKELLIDELVHLYGEQARNPEHFITQDWNEEPFTNGCFSGHFTPGGFIKYGEYLQSEVDGIHFAGTETATIWNGYFEGAVRSGEREAQKILAKAESK
ncbi:FAD-dependent oxidoreductase [Enterococcus sp. 669A]|uniref:FAD-dependent oxidoreductase n=1 Tax=Candidatus Enterococcus moelleringii TaxID=2815325 RepID=A0ABS3LBS0_9ENTE|nr:FAD-dependent oxidoreductase [Enterococcus sp. 669A]MBO1307082.1 FAD-dependent oxidoreductase [Enterococcus sp. 669A]